MSSIYIERLRRVSREYEALRQAVVYVINNWQQQDIYNKIQGITPQDFKRTVDSLERTYFIRLFAEFEGILKDHLDTNYSTVLWKGKPRADKRDKIDVNENITLVVKHDNIKQVEGERQRLLDIRNYRNSIAHFNSTAPAIVTFNDALSRLNTFLAKLPDPVQ